jgi:hypothetical protein
MRASGENVSLIYFSILGGNLEVFHESLIRKGELHALDPQVGTMHLPREN